MTSLSDKLQVHKLSADLVVVGGGMSGISAAIAAARNGSTVVLIQDRSVLGGNASSEIKMHIVGADCHGQRPGTRESGIIEELKLEDATRNSHRSYSQWDLLLYEKVKAEPNITLLLDTTCIACVTDPATKKIVSLSALRNSTDDLFEISGRYFADCSGDSRLAVEAGADYHVGRESKADFGESLAQEKPDKHTLGSSILITGRKYDTPQPFRSPNWVRKFTKDDLKHRPIYSYEYGYWWFEWGGQHDTIKDNEMIRHELLRIALGIWDFVKNSGNYPDSANWALDWVGSIPGKRESRRLLGPYILTEHDIREGRIHKDAIGYGGWAIDIHPPSGVDAKDEPPFTPTGFPHTYTIPYGVLYSRNVPNLLFAGRNISATHAAFASTRVMATCAIMGQAVGTAAALAAQDKIEVKDVSILKLQQTLLKDDAYIPTLKNEDSADLALQSRITASSETEGNAATLVIDGISRDLIGKWGDWADQKSHKWESADLPAWIELKLPKAAAVKEIHLTFDSGFTRELILSPSDRATSKVIRAPQPETVKSYQVFVGDKLVVSEDDNYLRKRVHKLDAAVEGDKVRILVTKTWGIKSARIFEVRVY